MTPVAMTPVEKVFDVRSSSDTERRTTVRAI
jgi:hypothetical protein